MQEIQRLAAEVREQNELYDAGKVEGAFWLGQQHRLEAIKAADPKLTQKAIGDLVGKSQRWVADVLKWDPASKPTPHAGARPEREPVERARQVLEREPERVAAEIAGALERPEVAEQVARNLTGAGLVAVGDATGRVGWERGRAERLEQEARDRGPTVGDVAGRTGETAEQLHDSMSEAWIDVPMVRAIKRVREMHAHMAHWGLVFSGGDTPAGHAEEVDWLERLLRAEADLAEVRAALQERIRDRGGAGVKGARA